MSTGTLEFSRPTIPKKSPGKVELCPGHMLAEMGDALIAEFSGEGYGKFAIRSRGRAVKVLAIMGATGFRQDALPLLFSYAKYFEPLRRDGRELFASACCLCRHVLIQLEPAFMATHDGRERTRDEELPVLKLMVKAAKRGQTKFSHLGVEVALQN